jgi:hypothetical protein
MVSSVETCAFTHNLHTAELSSGVVQLVVCVFVVDSISSTNVRTCGSAIWYLLNLLQYVRRKYTFDDVVISLTAQRQHDDVKCSAKYNAMMQCGNDQMQRYVHCSDAMWQRWRSELATSMHACSYD